MAVSNNTGPNSQVDAEERFSGNIDAVADFLSNPRNVSVRTMLSRVSAGTAEKINNGQVLLNDLINNLDRPILKGMVMDSITVLTSWFEDPEVHCCLIQGLWAIYASKHSHTELADLQRRGINIADTEFAKWLDILIAFIDLIIVFVTSDIKKIVLFIPDFIKEITNGIVGAILMVLQQALFSIRDSIISEILAAIDEAAEGDGIKSLFAKCIPFSQLLDVIKKYVHDYGLFAELFEKIKGFVSGKVGEFSAMKELGFPKAIQDVEFLYWFRDLLVKLKQAAINFDLCVSYDTVPTGGTSGEGTQLGTTIGDRTLPLPDQGIQRNNPAEVQGLKVAGDGTILQDKGNQGLRENNIAVLTNSSVRNFLNKYYGYPLAVVDNILTGTTSADNIQGTQINSDRGASDFNADCPGSPSPQEIVRWAMRVRNRNL